MWYPLSVLWLQLSQMGLTALLCIRWSLASPRYPYLASRNAKNLMYHRCDYPGPNSDASDLVHYRDYWKARHRSQLHWRGRPVLFHYDLWSRQKLSRKCHARITLVDSFSRVGFCDQEFGTQSRDIPAILLGAIQNSTLHYSQSVQSWDRYHMPWLTDSEREELR